MSYHKQYYKDHPELKEKQKLRYASLTDEQKKEFLDKIKNKRANETPDQRETRLASQRLRYQKNKNERLEYQKKYNQKKNVEIMTLKDEILQLRKQLENNG